MITLAINRSMMIFKVCSIGVSFISAMSVVVSSQSYKAAVVEFAPESYLTDSTVMLQDITVEEAQQYVIANLRSMEELAQNASIQGAKIVVFSEYAITGGVYCILRPCKNSLRAYAEYIPDIMSLSVMNPCTDDEFDDRPILRRLSCIARNHSIVLVANMPHKEDSEKLFNANVVFETDGRLIAKYYKYHIFREEEGSFDAPSNADAYRYTVFTTSFGVEFSTFICNDILFCDPPLEMVNRGIKNFVFTTYWGNRYPHYVSVSVRQGWSWRNKVNILSSGINKDVPKYFSTGSGIYSAGKPLDYYISGETFTEPSGRLIIADVPLEPGRVDMIGNGQRLQLTDVTSRTTPFKKENVRKINVSQTYETVSFVHEDFGTLECCIKYEFSNVANDEAYKLAASIFMPDSAMTYALCTLFKESPQSSGYTAASTFRYLKLNGSFLQYPQITVIPMVLGDQLRLLNPSLFNLGKDSLELQNNEQNILAVNLWGKIAGANDGFCSAATDATGSMGGEGSTNVPDEAHQLQTGQILLFTLSLFVVSII